eukprot:1214238-Pyramimonas_sp.AAC.1
MRAQQLYCFAVLKWLEWRSGTIEDRQDATVRLIRGVGVPKTMFWYAPAYSNGCLPAGQFPQ